MRLSAVSFCFVVSVAGILAGQDKGPPVPRQPVAPVVSRSPGELPAKVIDRIRGGSVIFSYYPDKDWLNTSRFLTGCSSAS